MKEELYTLLHRAGAMMLEAEDIRKTVSEKEGPANFVTTYDVAIQEMLRKELLLLLPGSHFVGEENEARDDVHHGYTWVVDPIDGTTNFIQGCRASAVSIALLKEGSPVVGAVYQPYTDELFYAEKGKGAFLNGIPIHVSSDGLSRSLICLGTAPYYDELRVRTFVLAIKLAEDGLDLRRSGSAVIDLCQVARGSAGLMFELQLSPWDHAAAGFILTEAGGKITQLDGSPVVYDRPCAILAGNPHCMEDFFRLGLDQL